MGDMGEVFGGMRAARQERHANWKEQNTAIIQASGLSYRVVNNGESLLFRERSNLKVDFYPSTGRWRVAGRSRTYRGGAEQFLRWYAKESN